MEVQLKKDKTRVKSNFTRSRNKLLDNDLPCRIDVLQARQNMDTCQAIVIEVLTNFSDLYTKNGKKNQKRKLVVMEMVRIEENFYMTSEYLVLKE